MGKRKWANAKVSLASALREVIWRQLMDQLTPEQQTLVQVLDSLGYDVNCANGLKRHPQGEEQAQTDLEEGISEALGVLPEDQWPLAVYDEYPERSANAEAQRDRRMWDAVQVLIGLPAALQRQAADMAAQLAQSQEAVA